MRSGYSASGRAAWSSVVSLGGSGSVLRRRLCMVFAGPAAQGFARLRATLCCQVALRPWPGSSHTASLHMANRAVTAVVSWEVARKQIVKPRAKGCAAEEARTPAGNPGVEAAPW